MFSCIASSKKPDALNHSTQLTPKTGNLTQHFFKNTDTPHFRIPKNVSKQVILISPGYTTHRICKDKKNCIHKKKTGCVFLPQQKSAVSTPFLTASSTLLTLPNLHRKSLQIHRMVQVGSNLQIYFQHLCHQQWYLPLDQAAQSSECVICVVSLNVETVTISNLSCPRNLPHKKTYSPVIISAEKRFFITRGMSKNKKKAWITTTMASLMSFSCTSSEELHYKNHFSYKNSLQQRTSMTPFNFLSVCSTVTEKIQLLSWLMRL